jgi:hypothetical protein
MAIVRILKIKIANITPMEKVILLLLFLTDVFIRFIELLS